MATLEYLNNMYDIDLKPRMLHELLKDDVPDDRKPFEVTKLSRILSMIQTHNLLSESFTESMGSKLVDRWKSAVDEWVNKLLSLISEETTPDKCWAAICLLGVTSQGCSSDRFLASYPIWLEKILPYIQFPEESQFVKLASFTSLSDIIARLAEFPNIKKEGTSLASKLIQPVLKLLKEDKSEIVWEGAIDLLCTVITSFPTSLYRHYDSKRTAEEMLCSKGAIAMCVSAKQVEDAIASSILSRNCSVKVLKRLAHCLALLPKSRGDEDSSLLMMRKILLLVNCYLTEIFHGLEDETKWDQAVRLILPPGDILPPSIWGQKLLEDTSDRERKRFKLSCISTLMLSCSTMLSNTYLAQASIPVSSILALVERVLTVNGSLSYSASRFVIATEQEFICSELPVLHSSSLELIAALIKAMRGQILPHAAYTAGLVKEYFRGCALPELRVKVYSIMKMLLITLGVGMAMYLAQDVVDNSLLDLNPIGNDTCCSQNPVFSSEALPQPDVRKRRKHIPTGPSERQDDSTSVEVATLKNHEITSISLKIAALEALEALLSVGGALSSESWRSRADRLLLTVATDSCKVIMANEEKNSLSPNGPMPTRTDLQLAAMRALLTSLLSPSRMRPPHLTPSLELFHRGQQETGTRLSEFCAHALLVLEVLIHPRGLSLTESLANAFPITTSGFPDTSSSQKHSYPFSSAMQEMSRGPLDSDDEMYESWLNTGKGADDPMDNLVQNIGSERPTESLRVQQEENISMAGTLVTVQSEQEAAAAGVYVETRNEIMVGSQILQQSVQPQEPMPSEVSMIPVVSTDLEVAVTESTGDRAFDSSSKQIASTEDFLAEKRAQKGKAPIIAIEPDDDSIPNIVDVNTDSD